MHISETLVVWQGHPLIPINNDHIIIKQWDLIQEDEPAHWQGQKRKMLNLLWRGKIWPGGHNFWPSHTHIKENIWEGKQNDFINERHSQIYDNQVV